MPPKKKEPDRRHTGIEVRHAQTAGRVRRALRLHAGLPGPSSGAPGTAGGSRRPSRRRQRRCGGARTLGSTSAGACWSPRGRRPCGSSPRPGSMAPGTAASGTARRSLQAVDDPWVRARACASSPPDRRAELQEIRRQDIQRLADGLLRLDIDAATVRNAPVRFEHLPPRAIAWRHPVNPDDRNQLAGGPGPPDQIRNAGGGARTDRGGPGAGSGTVGDGLLRRSSPRRVARVRWITSTSPWG